MKGYTYFNHWLKDSDTKNSVVPTKFKYPDDFETYWHVRRNDQHKGKLLAQIINHYGIEILEKQISTLGVLLKTPLAALGVIFEIADANLTEEAKKHLNLVKSNHKPLMIEGRRIQELKDMTIEQQTKWLSSTDIDLYLRFFHS
jgi:hypothetical protein